MDDKIVKLFECDFAELLYSFLQKNEIYTILSDEKSHNALLGLVNNLRMTSANKESLTYKKVKHKLLLNIIIEAYLIFIKVGTFTQGSEEWLRNRRKSIGCSELGELIHPTLAKKRDLVINKLGLSKMRDGIPQLMWGHAFEITTKVFTEIFFDCHIAECPGSVPYKGKIDVTNSSDGLGTIRIPIHILKLLSRDYKMKDLTHRRGKIRFDNVTVMSRDLTIYNTIKAINNKILRGEDHSIEELILLEGYPYLVALFEFKSPYSRVLSDEMIIDYSCQVQGGLSTLTIADLGFYTECRFVNCRIDQFGFTDQYVDFRYNNSDDGEFCLVKPLKIGIKLYVMKSHAKAYFEEYPLEEDIFITSNIDYQKFGDRMTFGQDWITIDCCFVEDNPIGNGQLFIKFIDQLKEYFLLSENFKCELENLFVQIINTNFAAKSAEVFIDTIKAYSRKDSPTNAIFAVQAFKLMDFRNAYIARISDFLDGFSDDINDVIRAVNLLGNQNNPEEIIERIPKMARKNANISEIIGGLI